MLQTGQENDTSFTVRSSISDLYCFKLLVQQLSTMHILTEV